MRGVRESDFCLNYVAEPEAGIVERSESVEEVVSRGERCGVDIRTAESKLSIAVQWASGSRVVHQAGGSVISERCQFAHDAELDINTHRDKPSVVIFSHF